MEIETGSLVTVLARSEINEIVYMGILTYGPSEIDHTLFNETAEIVGFVYPTDRGSDEMIAPIFDYDCVVETPEIPLDIEFESEF